MASRRAPGGLTDWWRAMHICSIITSYTAGGAEVIAANLSNAFTSARHRSTMLALCDAASVGNPQDYERLLMRRISKGGGAPRSLKLANRRNVVLGALAMRRMIGDLQPDIIHAHTAQALLLLLFAGVRRPIVYTHHNIRCNFPPMLFHAFDWIVDRYVAIGDACQSVLNDVTRRPVVLIRNGVPAAFSDAPQRQRLPRDPVLLSAGALTPQKDYPNLIRAAAIVVRHMAASGRTPRFRIAGGGPEMERLRVLVDSLALRSRVELLGTRPDVPALMCEADVMVNCSLYEGLPIALIEAQMSALPIIATDVGGNGELVVDGLNGRLVPPGDPQALAEAILHVLEDEARYTAMSGASVARSRTFTLDNCTTAHLQLYADVCAARSGRRAIPIGQAECPAKRPGGEET